MRNTKIFSVLILIILLFSTTGCKQEKRVETQGQKPQEIATQITTLHLEGGNIGTPNPFRHTPRGPGMARMQILYDSLLEKDEKGIIPWLAETWEANATGSLYRFKLHENILWHDGSPLTAEDIAFTFAYYQKHPPITNELLVNGSYIVASTTVIDPLTIEIQLTHFDHTFLAAIGSTRILPKHIWEQVEDPNAYEGEGATIGSGPYKVDSINETQGTYRYVAFDSYWGPQPAVAAIEWIPVSDSILAFENGKIDLVNVPADLLDRYAQNAEFTIKRVPSLHSYRLMMNMETVEELKEQETRQAIAYALDRQGMIQGIARGAATLSSMGYVPMESEWYNPDIEQYPFDLEKAKSLMGQKAFAVTLLTDSSSEGTKLAELIRLNLSKIGIAVTVRSVETRTRDNALKNGAYELLLLNLGGLGGDPNFLRSVYGRQAGTIKGWEHEQLFALLDAQGSERNAQTRKEMIFKAQSILASEVPMILLYGALDSFTFRQEKYNGWMCRFDHNKVDHNKLSYVIR